MTEYLVRFLLGGVVVSAFASTGGILAGEPADSSVKRYSPGGSWSAARASFVTS